MSLLRTPNDYKVGLQHVYDTKDRDGLHAFIKSVFGLHIARNKVCPDHDAPFDFVADVFFQKHRDVIAVANRGGGKTINFSILDMLNSFLHDNCETATVGAIEMQAKKCYSYLQGWTEIPQFAAGLKASLQSESKFDNGASVQILVGTMSGVNSPHPQKVFLDEVELMAWPILQEAFSMAQSKDNVVAQTVITSSRKFPTGPMERLLKEHIKRGFKVYRWCIKETIQPHDPEKCLASEYSADCQGDCHKPDGYYSLDDVIAKKKQLDFDTWESQWMSKRPMAHALVYPQFEVVRQVKPLKPDLGAPLYLAEDFGFAVGHANVVGFFQILPSGIKHMLDEVWIEGCSDQEIIKLVEEKLLEMGFVIPRYADPLKRKEYKKQFTTKVASWACPVEEPSKISIRSNDGYSIITQRNPDIRRINYGIPLIRKDCEDDVFFIDPKCVGTIGEMGIYSNKKRADGTILNEPEKKNDNGPDMIRYFYINHFSTRESSDILESQAKSVDEMETAGIRDMTF